MADNLSLRSREVVVKPYLNRAGDLAAWFIDPSIEQAIESAVQPALQRFAKTDDRSHEA